MRIRSRICPCCGSVMRFENTVVENCFSGLDTDVVVLVCHSPLCGFVKAAE